MSISEAHRKLGHISYTTIKHAISTGRITGIDLDMDSKPEFCEACVKAKSSKEPFPKKWIPELPNMASEYIGICGDQHQ